MRALGKKLAIDFVGLLLSGHKSSSSSASAHHVVPRTLLKYGPARIFLIGWSTLACGDTFCLWPRTTIFWYHQRNPDKVTVLWRFLCFRSYSTEDRHMNECGTKPRPLAVWVYAIRLYVRFELLHFGATVERHLMGMTCLAVLGPVSYAYDAAVAILIGSYRPMYESVQVMYTGLSKSFFFSIWISTRQHPRRGQ